MIMMHSISRLSKTNDPAGPAHERRELNIESLYQSTLKLAISDVGMFIAAGAKHLYGACKICTKH